MARDRGAKIKRLYTDITNLVEDPGELLPEEAWEILNEYVDCAAALIREYRTLADALEWKEWNKEG